MSKITVFRTIYSIAALALSVNVAKAQSSSDWSRNSAGAYGGVFQWDGSGTGTSWIAGARGTRTLVGQWLLGEGSFNLGRMREQLRSSDTQFQIADAQLQFQAPFSRIRPYLGVGGGEMWASGASRWHSQSPSAATGIRAFVARESVIQVELRMRGWKDYHAGAASWTVGLSRQF